MLLLKSGIVFDLPYVVKLGRLVFHGRLCRSYLIGNYLGFWSFHQLPSSDDVRRCGTIRLDIVYSVNRAHYAVAATLDRTRWRRVTLQRRPSL
jgi:hypothetical protein